MAKTFKDTKKGAKAPEEKKTVNKKQVSEKSAKNIKEVVIQPEPPIEDEIIVPAIEEPTPTESSEVPVSEDGLILNEVLPVKNVEGITHTKEDLEGGLCRVTYSDGSSQTMTLAEYQELPGILLLPVKTVQLTKSKEEMDEEAHWMGMGQIEHYNKFIKKN